MEIDVVIPNWNGRDLLHDCLESLRPVGEGLRLRVVLVDNASTDGSIDLLRHNHPEVDLLINERNEGFARACNRGAARGAAPYVMLLNTDAVMRPGAVADLVRLLEREPRAALAGPRLLNPDGSFQSSHSTFPTLAQDLLILTAIGRLVYGSHYPSHGPGESGGARSVDWVGGACLLVRRRAWEQMGGFDESYFMYAEELDLCYRLRRAGWEIWYEPAAVVVHLGGGSARRIPALSEARNYKSRIRYYRLHHGAGAAAVLQAMIFAATAAKIVVNRGLRTVSRGRRGRQVVSLRCLRAVLREG